MAGFLGALTEGPLIDKVIQIFRQVGHRGKVHIDIQGAEQGVLFRRVGKDGLHVPLGIELLGGEEGRFPELGVGADTDHGAALLVRSDEQGNLDGVLAAVDGIPDLVRRFVFKIPTEQEIAAQVVLLGQGRSIRLGAPGEEKLTHLFLQGHGGQQAGEGLLPGLVVVIFAQVTDS